MMKKQYIYAKDEFNRITEIFEASELLLKEYDHYQVEEFEEQQVQNLQIGLDGLVNGNIIYIGFTEDEIKNQKKDYKVERIQILKKLLADTDWKVIVNSELIQEGLPPKYLNLHEERQAWRDEINQLEQQINSLENN